MSHYVGNMALIGRVRVSAGHSSRGVGAASELLAHSHAVRAWHIPAPLNTLGRGGTTDGDRPPRTCFDAKDRLRDADDEVGRTQNEVFRQCTTTISDPLTGEEIRIWTPTAECDDAFAKHAESVAAKRKAEQLVRTLCTKIV